MTPTTPEDVGLADQSTIVSADSDVAQSALLTMVRHPYANFVVQTLVDVASEEQRRLGLLGQPIILATTPSDVQPQDY
mgnify:CR=1 FL=1